jgi:hypothetical protein
LYNGNVVVELAGICSVVVVDVDAVEVELKYEDVVVL